MKIIATCTPEALSFLKTFLVCKFVHKAYVQIEINHENIITQPLLILQIYLPNFWIFAHGKYQKQNDIFLVLISEDLDFLEFH